MKRVMLILLIAHLCAFGQENSSRPANSVYKNFKPFSTPRTNYRPGTVYRLSADNVQYVVKDISSIKSLESYEGDVVGRMVFSKEEMLECLNIEFTDEFVTTEVELKDAVREYTEQTNVDNILWNNDAVDELIVDPESSYFIIRETVSVKEITFRFDKTTADNIASGKSSLKEKSTAGDTVIDYPFSITKKFSEPKRLFYLDQKIEMKPYAEEL
ncbi:MAG: hypothetical protein JW995_00105 [Melioribacteraceae bacterium]|nr:hypothetical protein [Melioribacteraceae bacterium]